VRAWLESVTALKFCVARLMTQVIDPATMIETALTAAAAGDYSAAERLLREAADVQEATLGSLHPDLAGTMNNLALVYERTNKIVEAEESYRRAHAIAVASLLPGHPFVATSLKNLVDFCEARDIPLWRPPAVLSDEEPELPSTLAAFAPEVPANEVGRPEADEHEAGIAVQQSAVVVGIAKSRRVALVGLAAAAVVVVSIVMRWSEASPASSSPAPAPATPAMARPATPAVPVESKPAATTAPAPVDGVDRIDRVDPVDRAEPRDTRGAAAPVTVLTAQLCSAIEKRGSPDWQCTSTAGDLQPGKYSFYTRLQSNADTTVEHRWYRDERLHQVMRLRIGANPSTGYRTFSSTTISPERTGSWKVELRAADGALLQEERFVVH
jgi:Protein of unknown function (DUF2914)/Tetratricopeptide repeat